MEKNNDYEKSVEIAKSYLNPETELKLGRLATESVLRLNTTLVEQPSSEMLIQEYRAKGGTDESYIQYLEDFDKFGNAF